MARKFKATFARFARNVIKWDIFDLFSTTVYYLIFLLYSIALLDFPSCVIGEQPELTAETLEIGDTSPFCWRNMFSCINLLRVLNKLTKWKQSRIMVSNQPHSPLDLYLLFLAFTSSISMHLLPPSSLIRPNFGRQHSVWKLLEKSHFTVLTKIWKKSLDVV